MRWQRTNPAERQWQFPEFFGRIGGNVCAFALWIVPSLGPLLKFLGHSGALMAAALASVLLPLTIEVSHHFHLDRTGQSQRRLLSVIALLLIAAFIVLFPIAKSGLIGPGSDRDDALNVPLRALLQGHSPYYAETYLENPPTPMPGALLLALPFFIIGTSALQNLFWLPVFVKFSPHLFNCSSSGVLYVLIFLMLCPAPLQDFVTGGDYLINCLYVIISMELVLYVACGKERAWRRFVTYLFFSICLSSRTIFAVTIPILAAFFWQQNDMKRTIEFVVTTVLLCAVINGPLFLYDPAHFPQVHLFQKLDDFPQQAHAELMVPAFSCVIATSSFLVAMSRARIYGMMAASFAVMFFPLYALQLAADPSIWVLLGMGSSLQVTVFGGIWLLNVRKRAGQPRGAAALLDRRV